MKQRMYNTFYRKFKNAFIANTLATLGYFILTIYYYVACVFFEKSNSLKGELAVEEARDTIMKIRPKPDMKCEAINLPDNKEIALSIIIPAYNVEKYIYQCLESVFDQKTKYQFEVIVVNDGSTDDTEKIIKQFEEKNMTYIKQNNQGLSAARNHGLNVAQGKYVMFIDSDDVLCPNAINSMMTSITENHADVVVGSYYMFEEQSNTRQECINKNKIITHNSLEAVKNPGYAWGKVYKRKLFEKNRFPVGAWYEDTMICAIIYRLCEKIVVLDKVVYGYRINKDGISKTARSSPKSIDHYWVMEDVLEKVKDNNLENDTVFYDLVLAHMSTFLYRRLSLMDDEIIKKVFVMACDMLKAIRPIDYQVKGSRMKRKLEKAFQTQNYRLWKLTSFLI